MKSKKSATRANFYCILFNKNALSSEIVKPNILFWYTHVVRHFQNRGLHQWVSAEGNVELEVREFFFNRSELIHI